MDASTNGTESIFGIITDSLEEPHIKLVLALSVLLLLSVLINIVMIVRFRRRRMSGRVGGTSDGTSYTVTSVLQDQNCSPNEKRENRDYDCLLKDIRKHDVDYTLLKTPSPVASLGSLELPNTAYLALSPGPEISDMADKSSGQSKGRRNSDSVAFDRRKISSTSGNYEACDSQLTRSCSYLDEGSERGLNHGVHGGAVGGKQASGAEAAARTGYDRRRRKVTGRTARGGAGGKARSFHNNRLDRVGESRSSASSARSKLESSGSYEDIESRRSSRPDTYLEIEDESEYTDYEYTDYDYTDDDHDYLEERIRSLADHKYMNTKPDMHM